jgi:hypothetical protein
MLDNRTDMFVESIKTVPFIVENTIIKNNYSRIGVDILFPLILWVKSELSN